MTLEQYNENLQPFAARLEEKHIRLEAGSGGRRMEKESADLIQSEGLIALMPVYDLINGFFLEWSVSKKLPELFGKKGRISMETIEEMIKRYNVINLGNLEKWIVYDVLEKRRNVELTGRFIAVETNGDICAGIFDNGDPKLYFHDFGNSFYSLDLDIFGYFKMALKSNGYSYWQQALVYHLYSKDESSTFGQNSYDDFAEDMSIIFEGFDLNEYLAFFESLRISKNE